MNDLEILVGSRSWSATPWNYSSMRYLDFAQDGTGTAIYGYGQTIYAKIKFAFELLDGRRLRLSYLASPAFQRFAGFTPTDANRENELVYSLIDDQQINSESITGRDFRFLWQLQFDHSPFPKGLTFPYEVPLDYYGYREGVASENGA